MADVRVSEGQSYYYYYYYYYYCKKQSSPITGLDRPRGLQEVKVPRFRDNGTGWW